LAAWLEPQILANPIVQPVSLVLLKISTDMRFISLKKVQPNSLKIMHSEINLPMMTQYSFMR
jgi:hypothetical protein